MLLEYIRFQSAQDPRPSGSTINTRLATADRAVRNEFPDAPCQIARGFHQLFTPQAHGHRTAAIRRQPVASKGAQRCIVPLSLDQVARFWPSGRTARDLVIVGLMLLQGLRSAEVLALNRTTSCFPKANYVRGNKLTFSPLAPEDVDWFVALNSSGWVRGRSENPGDPHMLPVEILANRKLIQ